MGKKFVRVTAHLSAGNGMAVSTKRTISIKEADLDDQGEMERFESAVAAQHVAFMRAKRERKVAKGHEIFDAAVGAEADRLKKALAISAKFADDVHPGLKKLGFIAGRDKILESVRSLKSARERRRKRTGSQKSVFQHQ